MIKTLLTIPFLLAATLGEKGPQDPYQDNVLQIRIFSFYTAPAAVANDHNGQESQTENRGNFTGHSFLEIKNISGSSQTVGHVVVPNNGYVTIGCWSYPFNYYDPNIPSSWYSVQSGAIWYNNEAYDTFGWGTMESYSLMTTTSGLGLEVLTNYLTTGSNSYWDAFSHTCANVAATLWNMIILSDSLSLNPSYWNFPSSLKDAIGTKPGYVVNASYQTGSSHGYVSHYYGSFHL